MQPGNIIFVSKQFEITQTSHKFKVASSQRPAIASNGVGRYAISEENSQNMRGKIFYNKKGGQKGGMWMSTVISTSSKKCT